MEYEDIFKEGLRTFDITCIKKLTLEGEKISCIIKEPHRFTKVKVFPIKNVEITTPITYIIYDSDMLGIQMDQNYKPVCKATKIGNEYYIDCIEKIETIEEENEEPYQHYGD